MPGMAGRAVNITARAVFFVSGAISIAVAALYAMLRGSDLPSHREWIIFTVVLGLAGAVNVLVAIFPVSWTARVCRIADKSLLFWSALRMFGIFAVVSYLMTTGFFFTPHEWNLSGFLWTFLLCPVYLVRETFDPSPLVIFLMLAPINGAVYGAVGSVIGMCFSRRSEGQRSKP